MKYRRSNWMIYTAVLGSVGLGCTLVFSQQAPSPASPSAAATTEAKPRGADPVPVIKSDDLRLKSKSFTFVRIKHRNDPSHPGHGERWSIGYPESDQKFSSWFEKMTGVKTGPTNIILSLTAPELRAYPFIYITEPGRIMFSAAEVLALREYLLSGGFLMVDDFWGELEWNNAAAEFRKVFPDQAPFELPIDHPIFHCYYDIPQKPQVPNRALGLDSKYNGGITWERSDAKEPHFRGLVDPKGRLVTVFCHNTALANGWKGGDEDDYYSKEFSRKKAFPMGINIVIYALTR